MSAVASPAAARCPTEASSVGADAARRPSRPDAHGRGDVWTARVEGDTVYEVRAVGSEVGYARQALAGTPPARVGERRG